MNRIAFLVPVLLAGLDCLAAPASPIHYSVDLADPPRHVVRVTVTIPSGRDEHELQLPVWNALYQVRDFAQYMNWIRASDAGGHALPLTQLNASRWKLAHAAAGATIEYEMFSNAPAPFGAELNSHHAFFNLAEILIYVDDPHHGFQEIEFSNLPAGWKLVTALPQNGNGFTAANYDQLVDSPVEIGDFTEQDFPGICGTYRVVLDSSTATQGIDKMVPRIRRIVTEASQWMNDCPFKTYTFFYHLSDPADNGMEHAYSTAITLRPKRLDGNMGTFDFITAHEFFHLWNVKRIRPQSLAPFDYTRANYTTALWFSEGVDTTAADCILLRAGLIDERRYLDALSETITTLENSPANATQSAEQSSLDAWLEKYPYYELPSRSISYYNKGEMLGVLLDLRMRAGSHDRASLQTLFRWMNDHYAKQGKFFADSAGVRRAAEMVSGTDLSDFFRDYVSGIREIPWDDFFASVGLRVQQKQEVSVDRGFDAVAQFDQPAVVVRVQPGSHAEQAGLQNGDVLEQVNGIPVSRGFGRDIDAIGPGGTLRLRVSHDGVERELQFTLGSSERTIFHLEDVPDITAEQEQHRKQWLFGNDDLNVQPKSRSEPEHPITSALSSKIHAVRSLDVPTARSSDSP